MLTKLLIGLLIVIVPLFVGYLIQIKPATVKYTLHFSAILLYILLFLMGISLAQIDNLLDKLPLIGFNVVVFVVVIHLVNFIFTLVWDKMKQKHGLPHATTKFNRGVFKDIAKLIGALGVGVLLGSFAKYQQHEINHALIDDTSRLVLTFLVLFVGIQLRNSGISIKQVLFHKEGIWLAVFFMISSLLGGLITAFILNYNVIYALGISSGMGWYSLSSIVIGNAWGPVQGSIAFFVDVIREVGALFLIPIFARNLPITSFTQAGATALDCTLPVIQRNLPVSMLPLVMSYAFFVNLIIPVLLVIFTSI